MRASAAVGIWREGGTEGGGREGGHEGGRGIVLVTLLLKLNIHHHCPQASTAAAATDADLRTNPVRAPTEISRDFICSVTSCVSEMWL